MTARRESGFTLVEMMVALFAFGIIASGAVLLLRFSVDSEIASRDRLEKIADMRRFTAVLNADLAQAVPRTSRDRRGFVRPAFDTRDDASSTLMLRLTRSGWTNFDNAPRSSLQRVEYHLENGGIERRGYAMLDGGDAQEGSVLVTGVTDASLRFRDVRGVWSSAWTPESPGELPVAMEMRLQRSENGAAQAPAVLTMLVGANY